MMSRWLWLVCLTGGVLAVAGADPTAEYLERIESFIETSLSRNESSIYNNLLRLHFEDPRFNEADVQAVVDKTNKHGEDGSVDFNLAALGWILVKYWDSPLLTQELKNGIVGSVTNLSLWYSDPGYLGTMQYWSENHQVSWHSAEYLIGAGFAARPELADVVFLPTGLTGTEHAARGRERLVRWFQHRLNYGFSEFNSDTYGKIAFAGVAAVAGCSPEPELRALATMVMNLQLYDFILAGHNTKLVTARGRAYAGRKLDVGGGLGLLHLLTGQGSDDEYGSAESVYLVLNHLNGYTVPTVYFDVYESVVNENLMLEERFGWDDNGSGVDEYEDGVNCTFWFGNGGYFSPEHPRCLFVVGDEYELWDRQEVFGQIYPAKILYDLNPGLVDIVGEIGAPLGHGPVLGPANMRTFRTPGIVLSSVQDYKGGYMAGQQQAWQATLDTHRFGTVFTVQPTAFKGEEYWEGGVLPKVVQQGSTLIAMYNPEVLNTVAFGVNLTHAHLRLGEYDEVYTHFLNDGSDASWRIVRQNDSYLALYSRQKAEFRADGEDNIVRDLVAEGEQNVWICEVGSRNLNGSFGQFMDSIIESEVLVDFTYDNSLGECLLDNDCFTGILEFVDCMLGVCSQTRKDTRRSDITVEYTRGDLRMFLDWHEGGTVNGSPIKTADFDRYNNVFGLMKWGARQFSIQSQDEKHFLNMDFDRLSIQQN